MRLLQAAADSVCSSCFSPAVWRAMMMCAVLHRIPTAEGWSTAPHKHCCCAPGSHTGTCQTLLLYSCSCLHCNSTGCIGSHTAAATGQEELKGVNHKEVQQAQSRCYCSSAHLSSCCWLHSCTKCRQEHQMPQDRDCVAAAVASTIQATLLLHTTMLFLLQPC